MTIDKVKTLIEKAKCEFGGEGNIAYLEAAYHACDPSREYGWDCNAIRIDGNVVELGRMSWDFEEDMEDASDYDWSDGDFRRVWEKFDLHDHDDLEHVIYTLETFLQ